MADDEEQQDVLVYMVRHGERIDETRAGDEWIQQNRDRWFDPPLTERGKEQASRAAEKMRAFVGDEAFDRVFSSPLVRCLETSAEFGKVLGLPVLPIPGLSTCTAAYKRHGDAQSLVSAVEARGFCPGVDVNEYDSRITSGFFETVDSLAAAAHQ